MSYAGAGGYYNDVKFVRPAHRLLALHGADVVPVTALGLAADRATDGHRFLSPRRHRRRERRRLRRNAARRRQGDRRIRRAARGDRRGARALLPPGATILMPDALLDEVTGLVEWPVVYAGAFDPAFLAVPQECLILTMQQNQKYFALADADGKLVAALPRRQQLETHEPGAIIQGNERVLRARLADARFFFDQDRKTRLEARVPKLATVVYHNKLGTQLDRVDAARAARRRRSPRLIGADRGESARAAQLAKADLATDMVGEFPELQGLMGRYYAAARRRAGRPSPPRSSSTTGRASPATRCRTGPSRRPWRSPTSSRRSPACSASARSRPATRTRSAFVATRSA